MIAEMRTQIPGPKSLAMGTGNIVFDNRFEGTNVWDIDGNCYLDLTSAGGTLPFGYIDSDLVSLRSCLPEVDGYIAYMHDATWLASQQEVLLGNTILASHLPNPEERVVSMAELSTMTGEDTDVLVVRAEYLNLKDLRMIKSWCQQFGVKLLLDERELGLYRSGLPLLVKEVEADFILSCVADENFGTYELLFVNQAGGHEVQLPLLSDEKVAENYADDDLTRTINLQSQEMNGLLSDSLPDWTIQSIGSFHTIEMVSEEEAERVCEGLLKRGIIVSRLATKVVLLPSLYLALGEIIFAVNHIRMVVRNVNEVERPWVSG